jgi:hypothetical protein
LNPCSHPEDLLARRSHDQSASLHILVAEEIAQRDLPSSMVFAYDRHQPQLPLHISEQDIGCIGGIDV